MKKLPSLLLLAALIYGLYYYYTHFRKPADQTGAPTVTASAELTDTAPSEPAEVHRQPPPPREQTEATSARTLAAEDRTARNEARKACSAFEKASRSVLGRLYPDNEHFQGNHNPALEGSQKEDLKTAFNSAEAAAAGFEDANKAGAIARKIAEMLQSDIALRQTYKEQVQLLYRQNGITNYHDDPSRKTFTEANAAIFKAWDDYRRERQALLDKGLALLKEQVRD